MALQIGSDFSTGGFGRIIIDAKRGNDHVDVTTKTTKDTLILGGTGADTVRVVTGTM